MLTDDADARPLLTASRKAADKVATTPTVDPVPRGTPTTLSEPGRVLGFEPLTPDAITTQQTCPLTRTKTVSDRFGSLACATTIRSACSPQGQSCDGTLIGTAEVVCTGSRAGRAGRQGPRLGPAMAGIFQAIAPAVRIPRATVSHPTTRVERLVRAVPDFIETRTQVSAPWRDRLEMRRA